MIIQSLITSLLRVEKTSSLLIKVSTEEFLTAILIFALFVTGKSRSTGKSPGLYLFTTLHYFHTIKLTFEQYLGDFIILHVVEFSIKPDLQKKCY